MTQGNFVSITGNTTRDVDLKFVPSGTAVATFGVAVNRRWQNRTTNEFEEETSFFDVTCWDKLAENVSESVRKGTRITVSGRLDQRSWDKDGEKKSKVEIVADEVALSLKWATGSVTKNERGGNGSHAAGTSRSNGRGATAVQEAPPVLDTDEEPFVVDAGTWWPEAGLGSAPKRMLP